jgi:ATP-dependent DNA helicase Q1
LLVGKKIVKLEISSGEKNMTGAKSAKRSLSSSVLEFQLDELRKELSSIQGGIFPHSVLSTQQISMINAQKPNSVEQASFIITSPICFE